LIRYKASESFKDKLNFSTLPGYFAQDKLTLLKEFLLPHLQTHLGLPLTCLSLNDSDALYLIKGYTREPGLYQLKQLVITLLKSLPSNPTSTPFEPSQDWMTQILGLPLFACGSSDKLNKGQNHSIGGVALALAHSSLGGEVFKVECKLLSGRGRIQITGNVGKIMFESCQLAMTLVRERLKKYDIRPELVKKTDVVLHFSDHSVPKEGPSAGLAITMAILSAFLQKPLPRGVAFSGELSLSGALLPVGGELPKLIAAEQYGVSKIYLPKTSHSDLTGISPQRHPGTQVYFTSNIEEVIEQCFPL